jgi:hypothetical protein
VQKRPTAPKMRARVAPVPDRETEVAKLTRERDEALGQLSEALERQRATSEVLRVISSSSGILEPVFQAMLANAVRICEAKSGLMCRSEGEALRAVALHGVPPSFAEERRRNPVIRPSPDSTLGFRSPISATNRLTPIHRRARQARNSLDSPARAHTSSCRCLRKTN